MSKKKLEELRSGFSFETPRCTPAQAVQKFIALGDSIPVSNNLRHAALGREDAVISESSADGTKSRVRLVTRSKDHSKIYSTSFSVLLTVAPKGEGVTGKFVVESMLVIKGSLGAGVAVKGTELEAFKRAVQQAVVPAAANEPLGH